MYQNEYQRTSELYNVLKHIFLIPENCETTEKRKTNIYYKYLFFGIFPSYDSKTTLANQRIRDKEKYL